MTSEALAKQTTYTAIERTLGSHFKALVSALPRLATHTADLHQARAQRAARVALAQLRANPRLLECTQPSIIGSILQACSFGLELDGVLGQAYLVPYKQICQMQVGYRGLIELATRSGKVASITAAVVRDGDAFDFELGLRARLHHKPVLRREGDDPPMICAYAIAYMTDGAPPAFEIVDLATIATARKRSPASAKKDSPWNVYPEEMAKKTAIRRLCKYLSQCVDAQRAAMHDEYIEAGIQIPQPTIDEIEQAIEVPAEEKEEKTDA